MSNNNRNTYAVQEGNLPTGNISQQMNSFKEAVAAEIGLKNYDSMDKRWMPAIQHGYVGGNMTKKMTAFAQSAMATQGAGVMDSVKSVVEVSPEVRRANELASTNFQQFTQALQTGNFTQDQLQ
ncbi:gp267 [Bacillus phage G]|uniref:Gp267 n=1 Tax=Bacillus phage G TaxID=2884420 RepID=G3MA08_9CAUD|nr:gp267 [Bacillus phage G]AEO93526.1 gp267 [Bacillus phage G]